MGDLHSSTTNVLPYTKIITDSAQGFGPEVMDFPEGPVALSVAYSTTYQPNSPANAYEIWIDRPNSSPNFDSAGSTISDTNAFIIVYRHTGVSASQLLFNVVTGVPYAYGFYNGDQWNQVPVSATMWHIIDFSQLQGEIVWDGFPDTPGVEADGGKYAYNAASIGSATKVIPCGHTTTRGANPAYCPNTLTYPQTKK